MITLKPNPRLAILALACGALGAGSAIAQNTKPPKAQLWMDVSTGTMAGMPEMDSLPTGAGGLLGGMMGGARGGAAAGGNTSYGAARGANIMPPRVLDIALHNSLRPGVEATQAIPAGMRMGDSLPLVPPKAQATREPEPTEVPDEYRNEKPKGRVLIYWGCGTEVRRGQPRIIDFARGNPAEFGTAFAGRYAADRGARVSPAHALYPNEKNRVNLGRDSSLVGEHRVQGDGVPASMKFTLGAAQDLMPAIALQTSGGLKDSMTANWAMVNNARAYYLHAMSKSGDDLIMWSSAEAPDTGMGLFDYLPNGTIERWLKDKVLLQPETTQCAIPKGIFAAAEGARGDGMPAMLRMMAYGGESNFAHPPRPADPRAVWEPEWAVRVRVKSHTIAMLGEEGARMRGGAAGMGQPAAPMAGAQDAQQPPVNPVQSAVESVLPVPNPVNLLKGLFGR
ncbi:MAG TPA: hypothetical protein VLJ57_06330 [Burkholderiaceae bacterium]|nr:hypothetical protein [Burkholderiaceae bacterium]